MIDIQLQRFSYFPLLFFFFFASFQGIKYILGRTEERDGRSWSERDGSVSKGRQIGKKREGGGGGGGQVRGHVCKRDKTSSFHFDWQAGGGPSEPPSPLETPTPPPSITLPRRYHTFLWAITLSVSLHASIILSITPFFPPSPASKHTFSFHQVFFFFIFNPGCSFSSRGRTPLVFSSQFFFARGHFVFVSVTVHLSFQPHDPVALSLLSFGPLRENSSFITTWVVFSDIWETQTPI